MDHTNCHVAIDTKKHTSASISSNKESLFSIAGMGCQNCANRVHNSILKLDGVTGVIVDLEMHSAQVNYDADKVTIPELVAAVSAAGNDGHHNYSARLIG